MAELESPAQAVLVEYLCDDCNNDVKYVKFDAALTSTDDPNVYIHHCSHCNKQYHFPVQYPTVRYKRI